MFRRLSSKPKEKPPLHPSAVRLDTSNLKTYSSSHDSELAVANGGDSPSGATPKANRRLTRKRYDGAKNVDSSVFKLSSAEKAFLCAEVRSRLAGSAGQFPPAPSVYSSMGAVMFVDISGFTALGERLKIEHQSSVEAARALAAKITAVLGALTRICLDFDGDISKFAGDALLCVWSAKEVSKTSIEDVLNRAKCCGIEMLKEMRRSGDGLEIHGGIAKGNVMHFHLGSKDDDLRWYMVAGEAVAGATTMVDVALPGEMACLDVVADRSARRRTHISAMFSAFHTGQQQQQQHAATAVSSDDHTTAVTSTPAKTRNVVGKEASPATQEKEAMFQDDMSEVVAESAPRKNTLQRKNPKGSSLAERLRNLEHARRSNLGGADLEDSLNAEDDQKSAQLKATRSTMLSNLHLYNAAEGGRDLLDGDVVVVDESIESTDVVPEMTPTSPMQSLDGSGSASGGRKTPTSAVSFKARASNLSNAAFSLVSSSSSRKHSIKPKQGGGVMIELPKEDLPTSFLTSETDPGLYPHPKSERKHGSDGGGGFLELPRVCNAYMPKSLRSNLDHVSGEMRSRVGVVFVHLSSLGLTEDEIENRMVTDEKMDRINSAFVVMTRISHAFQGEVRDMLFDDKGCIFISVFNGHTPNLDSVERSLRRSMFAEKSDSSGMPPRHDSNESSDNNNGGSNRKKNRRFSLGLVGRSSSKDSDGGGGNESRSDSVASNSSNKAIRKGKLTLVKKLGRKDKDIDLDSLKAAMAIQMNVKDAKIGVSAGSCFVGLCGNEKRHDFVVIGHEVNMAARLMVKAEPGSVLCSPAIKKSSEKFTQFSEVLVAMSKGNAQKKDVVFKPSENKRASFLAQFRYAVEEDSSGAFVGREMELDRIGSHLNKICFGKERKSSVIVVEAAAGVGKSSLLHRARQYGRGRIKIASARCLPTEIDHEYFAIRQILEAFTGLGESLSPQENALILDELDPMERRDVDVDALSVVMPFLSKNPDDLPSIGTRRVLEAFTKVMRRGRRRFGGAEGTLVILEDAHWIDHKSKELMSALLEEAVLNKVPRLVVLLSVRPSYPNGEALLDKATEISSHMRVVLRGLSRADVDALIERALGGASTTIDKPVLDLLWKKTKGHPMHLSLLLRFVKENGLLKKSKALERVSFTSKSSKIAPQLPDSPESAFAALFEKLSKPIKEVLSLASLAGEAFDATFVVKALEANPPSAKRTGGSSSSLVLELLRDALQQGFVTHHGGGQSEEQHRWQFAHDLARTAIFDLMKAAERKRLSPLMQAERLALNVRLSGYADGDVDVLVN